MWLSIAHYFVVEELVQRAWTLPYSRRTNVISDLGALTCGPYGDRVICSPAHGWINGSFALVGAAAGVGAVILRSAAPKLITRAVLASYAAAGAGSVLVATFPEDTISSLHVVGATGYFVGANLGHLLLGSRLRRTGQSRRGGAALAVLGGIGLVATGFVAAGADLGLGIGLMERIVVYGADLGFLATGAAVAVSTRSRPITKT